MIVVSSMTENGDKELGDQVGVLSNTFWIELINMNTKRTSHNGDNLSQESTFKGKQFAKEHPKTRGGGGGG